MKLIPTWQIILVSLKHGSENDIEIHVEIHFQSKLCEISIVQESMGLTSKKIHIQETQHFYSLQKYLAQYRMASVL